MSKSIAVLISDVHYNIHTLTLADATLNLAVARANSLRVPLIIAGDLHDTKANMRGECVNAMIKTLQKCNQTPYILVGNHDRLNEKAPEHSLNFLSPYATIVDEEMWLPELNIALIPYQQDSKAASLLLKHFAEVPIVIMHQGLTGSDSGEYIQDKSAISINDTFNTVISGHYHRRQTIKNFSYIGNPYTLGFGEAEHPRKGFQVLHADGSLKFVPTNLRKHVIFNVELVGKNYQITGKSPIEDVYKDDLIWVKFTGTKEQIANIDRTAFLKACSLPQNSRVDLIPTDTETSVPANRRGLTDRQLLDSMIDSTNTSDERKARLKELVEKATCG